MRYFVHWVANKPGSLVREHDEGRMEYLHRDSGSWVNDRPGLAATVDFSGDFHRVDETTAREAAEQLGHPAAVPA